MLARLTALVPAVACGPAGDDSSQTSNRVVSLAPVIADAVVALGATDQLVGRTRWGPIFVPEVHAIHDIGDGLQPNIEAIVATEPDLVLMYRTSSNASAIRQLRQFGIEAREYPLDQLVELPPALREIGALLGRAERADSVADAFEAWVREAPPPLSWRIAFVVEDQPLITLGSGSFLTGIARRAGAANVFGDLEMPSPIVSLEALIDRNPDALILFGASTDGAFLRRPEWQHLPAVRNGRIIFIDGAGFGYPSVHAPGAVERLRAQLRTLP